MEEARKPIERVQKEEDAERRANKAQEDAERRVNEAQKEAQKAIERMQKENERAQKEIAALKQRMHDIEAKATSGEGSANANSDRFQPKAD